MSIIVDLSLGSGGSRRRKKNDREWIILNSTASVHEDGIMKCTENCWIIGEQGERENVSNRGD
jgi:hypothetical protein